MNPSTLELPPLSDDFGFDDDHDLARRAVRRFIAERCTSSEIRRLVDDPIGYDPALHREAAELGYLGLTSPSEYGGAELGHLHLAILMDELGRALWPTPLFASVLAAGVLESSGSAEQKQRHLPAILAGETIATVAFTEPDGRWLAEHIATEATPEGGGYALRGKKTHVLFGNSANLIVVPCREPNGALGLYLLEISDRSLLEPEVCVDTTRPTARLTLDSVHVGRDARLEVDGAEALRAAQLRGAALMAAEMIGAAEAVLEKTRQYAIERMQFGRAIGSFQAVKHPIVDLMIGVELGRSLAFGAATLLDTGGAESERAARMAKAHAGDVLGWGVQKGVQLHGGFGFTWDCDVHFHFKRALFSRSMLGDAIHHRAELARSLFG